MRWIAALAFLTTFSAWAQQPAPGALPQPAIGRQINEGKAEEPKKQSATEQKTAAPTAPIVKIPQREEAQKEPKASSDKAPDGSAKAEGWSLSDKIAIGALIAALLQFGALVWTIREMRNSAQRQLRAYLFVESAQLMDGTQTDPPLAQFANVPGCVLLFKNSGQTPAYRIRSWAELKVIDPEMEKNLIVPKNLPQVSESNLGSNAVMPKNLVHSRVLGPNDIDDIKTGKKYIYVCGRIEYRDAFKKKRFSTFRVRYAGIYPPLKGTTFSICNDGNEAN